MDEFITEAFTLLGVALVVVGLRTYVRLTTVGIKGFQADDYLMLVAAGAYTVETYLAYSVGAFWKGLANNAMTDEQRRLLDPNSEEFRLRVNGSKTQVAGWSTYTFLLWTIKAAICTFYLRLTEGLEYRKRIFTGFVMIFVTWVAVLLSILLGCRPLEKNWQIYPDPGNFCQPAISNIDIFVTLSLNVATDIYLMSIPIPMLMRASMKPLKKIGLIVLFSGGAFVTVAGVLRCILIVTDPINGAQQAGSWAVRETFVAVVTSNLPMCVPLINRWGRPILGGLKPLKSTTGRMTRSGRSDPKHGAFRLEDKNPRRGLGPRSVNPITDLTLFEAELNERPYIEQQENVWKRNGANYDSEVGVEDDGTHRGGFIWKQTSLQVSESRNTHGSNTDDHNFGDYYLVGQAKKSAEAMRTSPSTRNWKVSGESRLGRRTP
ncbi:hypothetical protein QBC40DRAFT_285165 [Triangularia verruculosa]|uniref:Rhodopsin domain-containing protein n=1 Tax=Triangularia verruculosa TaxID=2587418 RepID=A0AAN7AQR8_9PEZI|nr:hypothetical protein QBC40DRAFT_285165 [Triangularia verruculosa]